MRQERNRLVKNVLIILLSLISVMSSGQDLKADFRKMYAQAPEEYGIEVSYVQIDAKGNSVGAETAQEFYIGKGFVYSKFGTLEYMLSGPWYVLVENAQKVIMYNKDEELPYDSISTQHVVLDSLYDKLTTYEFKGIEKGLKKYSITPNDTATYQEMYVYIDPATTTLKKTKYIYNKKVHQLAGGVIISYAFIDIDKAKVQIETYLDISSYPHKVTEKYLNYKLIEEKNYEE